VRSDDTVAVNERSQRDLTKHFEGTDIDWAPIEMQLLRGEPGWRIRYRKSLEDYLVPYQQRYSDTQPISNGHSSADQISDIDMLITSATSFQPQANAHSELTRYLGSSMLPSLISYVSFTYLISRHSSD
jgi:hypothetical protein